MNRTCNHRPVTGTYSHSRTSIDRHVAWIEFNRPPINAFNRAMVDGTHRGFIPPIATTQALARLIGRPRSP